MGGAILPPAPVLPPWPSVLPGQIIGGPVTDIVHGVQVQFDALDQDWCDRDYILGFLETHSEDVENMLENLDLAYDQVVLVFDSVPAGTTDFSSQQGSGKALQNMYLPVTLEWKLPGQPDTYYVPVPRVDKVIDVLTDPTGGPSNIVGIASYEWRQGIIFISPSSTPVDSRLRFEQLPMVLNNDSAQYIKGLKNALIYGVCEQIAMSRGGGVSKQAPWFAAKFEKAWGLVEDREVKNEQLTPRRMAGRRSQQQGPLWSLPLG